MRHGKKFNHLGRTSSHRKALLSNMASSLILHKRITTTLAKAKELRKYVEPLITKSKDNTTHNRRLVFSYLGNKHSVSELFGEVATKVADRPGGYTRILKLGNRLGDNAEMALIELVDYNEYMLEAKKEKKAGAAKTRRSRRGGGATKAKEAAEKAAPVAEAEVVETVEEVKAEAVEAEVAEEVKEESNEEVTAESSEEPKAETTEEAPEAKSEDASEEEEKKD